MASEEKNNLLVNVYVAIENHHCELINPLFLWTCAIAILNYQRVYDFPI
jgi:hypothetical protein